MSPKKTDTKTEKKAKSAKDTPKKRKSTRAEIFEGIAYIVLAFLLFSIPKIIIHHPNSIQGKLLVAAAWEDVEVIDGSYTIPDEAQPLVESVILITAHDRRGAKGYVINKPTQDISLKDLYHKLDIQPLGRSANLFITPAYAKQFLNSDFSRKIPIYWGGPLEEETGRIIFKGKKYTRKRVKKIHNTDLKISTDMKALNRVVLNLDKSDADPYKFIFGFAQWSGDQLDQEIEKEYWHVLPYDEDIVLNTGAKDIWHELQKRVEKSDEQEITNGEE